MPLESATYISQLDATNPTPDDPRAQGDDHLRLIKAVLKAQFPNIGAAAANPTATELNRLVGLAGNILCVDVYTRSLNRPFSLRFENAGTTNTPTLDFAGRGVIYHTCSGPVTINISNAQPGAWGVVITANSSNSQQPIAVSGITTRDVRSAFSKTVGASGISGYAISFFFCTSTVETFWLFFNAIA